MPKKDKLHILVHSLNANEKKSVKQYLKKQGVSSKYALLIDEITKMENPDNTLLQERLKKHEWSSRIRPLKSECFELCLSALREYHFGTGIHRQAIKLLEEGETLFHTGLKEEGIALIRKGIAAAESDGLWPLALHLQKRLLWCVSQMGTSNIRKHVEQALQEIATTVNFIMVEQQTSCVDSQLFLRGREQSRSNDEILRKSAEELLPTLVELRTNKANPRPFDTSIANTLLRIYRFLGDDDKVVEQSMELMTLMNDLRGGNRQQQLRFLTSSHNIASALLRVQKLEEFKSVLQSMNSLHPVDQTIKTEQLQDTLLLRSVYGLNFGGVDWDSFAVRVEQSTKQQSMFAQGPIKTLYYNIGLAFFIQQKWSKALEWFSKVAALTTKHKQQLSENATILSVLCFAELEYWESTASQLRKLQNIRSFPAMQLVKSYTSRLLASSENCEFDFAAGLRKLESERSKQQRLMQELLLTFDLAIRR